MQEIFKIKIPDRSCICYEREFCGEKSLRLYISTESMKISNLESFRLAIYTAILFFLLLVL